MARASKRSNRPWLLLLEPDAWQLVPPEDLEQAPERVAFPPELLGEQAEAVLELLATAGWRSHPLVIGVAASCCLSATVDVPSPALLRKRQAMRFHLEGWIPWSAEEFVADVVPHKTSALMVAIKIEPLRSLLAALEQRDASPVAIIPTAFLALERHLASREAPADHALILQRGEQTDFFVIRDGQPHVWRHVEGIAKDDLRQTLAADSLELDGSISWVSRGLNVDTLQELETDGVNVTSLSEFNWTEVLRQSAAEIAAGRREPFITLRRDELAGERPIQAVGPQLKRLKIAAALAVLSICGALWLRGEQFAENSREVREHLTAVFEETFPKEPPPERVLSAIRKSHSILQGTRGPVKSLPDGPSSDQILQQVLAALPNDLRYRVPEIRIEGSGVHLGGEVRSNADADRLALSLRSAGFEVDSPRTQRLAEQGFSVRLAAELTPPVQGAVRK